MGVMGGAGGAWRVVAAGRRPGSFLALFAWSSAGAEGTGKNERETPGAGSQGRIARILNGDHIMSKRVRHSKVRLSLACLGVFLASCTESY